MRYLIVNADDFGFTRDVNAGIALAHREGILTATTLMANGAAFDDAVSLAAEAPTLDVGVHLQMVQGPSLSQPGRMLPETIPALIRDLTFRRWDIFAELSNQVERILAVGIRPTHLDTHKHTHLLPPVLSAVARLSQQYEIPWVRRPFDLPLDGTSASLTTRTASLAMKRLRRYFGRVLSSHGARSTDHFAGFVWTGLYQAEDLIQLIEQLPEGSTEFMCHPGICGPELLAASTRLKQTRQQELNALIDPRVRHAIEASKIHLTSYRQLSGQ